MATMEPDNMLSTRTLEEDDKKICTHTSTTTTDKGDNTKDANNHNDDDDKEHDNDNDKTGSMANNKDNSIKDITSSSSSSSSVAMKRMSSTASLSESSSSKRVKQEDISEEKARSPSALIEIVNDFARDHFDDQGNTYPLLYNGTGPISPILNENEYLRGYYDEQFIDESKTSDTEAKTDWEEEGREQPQGVTSATSSSENIDPIMPPPTDYSLSSIQSRRKSYQQIEQE